MCSSAWSPETTASHSADRAEHEGPEAHQPERFPLRGDRQDVKECGPEEQGDGKIVQGGVQARPIVAEHGRPGKGVKSEE